MSTSAPPPHPSSAADDPEEDYDDLDDVIPSFSAPPPPPIPAPQPPAGKSSRPAGETEEDDLTDEAFAAELAKGMESLLLELAGGTGIPAQPPLPGSAPSLSSTGAVPAGEDAEARQMREAWEKVFADAITNNGDPQPSTASAAPGPPKPRTGSTAGKGKDEDFQRTIRETMERLKQSSDDSSKPAAGSDDPLAALLASLGDLGGDGGDGEGVLESMMDGLMSKDVLYDPLKELSTKYPPYLLSPEALALPAPQLHAYKLQAELVKEIVALFDRPDFKDDDDKMKADVRELMGKMQDLGSPPKEVMGDMPEGFELGADGMPNLGALGDAEGSSATQGPSDRVDAAPARRMDGRDQPRQQHVSSRNSSSTGHTRRESESAVQHALPTTASARSQRTQLSRSPPSSAPKSIQQSPSQPSSRRPGLSTVAAHATRGHASRSDSISSSGGSSISSASSGGSERADSPVQNTAAPVVGWKEWAFGGRGAPATGVAVETGAEIRDDDAPTKEDLSDLLAQPHQSLWSTLASTTQTLLHRPAADASDYIGYDDGPVTPMGAEGRLEKAMKKWYVENAESRADLPDWLFTPSALVAPPPPPVATSTTKASPIRSSSSASHFDVPTTTSTKPRNLLRDIYDTAPAAPVPVRRPTRAGEGGGKATERLRAMRAERVPVKPAREEVAMVELRVQEKRTDDGGDRGGRRKAVGLPTGPRRGGGAGRV